MAGKLELVKTHELYIINISDPNLCKSAYKLKNKIKSTSFYKRWVLESEKQLTG